MYSVLPTFVYKIGSVNFTNEEAEIYDSLVNDRRNLYTKKGYENYMQNLLFLSSRKKIDFCYGNPLS